MKEKDNNLHWKGSANPEGDRCEKNTKTEEKAKLYRGSSKQI